LGVGRKDEPYEGIGRGVINIEGLPVYRDEEGGVGTPTSDHERTKITLATTHMLVLINGYDGNEEQVLANARFIRQLVVDYCGSQDASITIYR
jgi:DNA/RNA-binding domain of Phe-tRNA-synthetase-like protein